MSILRYCVNNLLEKACYLADINKHNNKYIEAVMAMCSYWQHNSDCIHCAVMFLEQPSMGCALIYPWLCVYTAGLLQSMWTVIVEVISAAAAECCSERYRKITSVTLGESQRLLSLKQRE